MRKNAWPKFLTILVMTISLGACQTGASYAVKIACPTIRSYDKATLEKALSEYQKLPAGSEIERMIGDYQVLRDKVRACRRQ